MRVLVTGADGFVGGHLCNALEAGGDVVVPACGVAGSPIARSHPEARVVDVRDVEAVRALVLHARPDAIVHLAADSSVARSHADPANTFDVNARGTLNVCIAARALESSVRLLLVSSGEVYGIVADQPASEETRLAPLSPYAASKAAAEIVALQFARSYGLHAIVARPFTHLGAGQAPTFAIPSFVRQVVAMRRAAGSGVLSVGDLAPVRDFSHVRDVAAAYCLLVHLGPAGETYNVCSGEGRSIRNVLDELIALAGVTVDIRLDPSKLRPTEIPTLVGSPAKLRALGWTPRWAVRDALSDVLAEVQGAPLT